MWSYSMNIYQPYTYLIGWTELDKWYYGVRYANTKPPEDDLWKQYFTSSKYVKEFREKFGEPNVVKIDRIFNNKQEAVNYEHQFLIENKALYSEKWLNKNIGGNIAITSDIRTKMSEAALRNVENGTHPHLGGKIVKKLVEDGTHNFLGGELQRKHQTKRVEQGTHHLLGGTIARQLLKEGRHPSQKTHTCPHCNKTGKGNAMKQHHFEKCKFKNKN